MTTEELQNAATAWHAEDQNHRSFILLTAELEDDGTTLHRGITAGYKFGPITAAIADIAENHPDIAQALYYGLHMAKTDTDSQQS